MAQLAMGARRPTPSSALPSILPVRARVAAGAWVPRFVSSRAPMALAIASEEAVCRRMRASRFTGSATFTPSMTVAHCTSGFAPGPASGSRT